MPSKNIFNQETLETVLWSFHEDKILMEGIEKYSIGQWNSIIIEFLPNWFFLTFLTFSRDSLELKKRACVLLGLTDLQELEKYKNWKGNEKDFENEKIKNQKENEKLSKVSTITFDREIFDYVETSTSNVSEKSKKMNKPRKKKTKKKQEDEDDYEDEETDEDDVDDLTFHGKVSKSGFERKSKRNARNQIEFSTILEDISEGEYFDE
jgi:hypothetical protein